MLVFGKVRDLSARKLPLVRDGNGHIAATRSEASNTPITGIYVGKDWPWVTGKGFSATGTVIVVPLVPSVPRRP